MSVELSIWANHNLEFSSYEEGIAQFERKIGKRIKHWNHQKDESLDKITDLAEVQYFVNFDITSSAEIPLMLRISIPFFTSGF